jgi:sugar transferase (PEP-CTERM/EpsH1 system associated)
MTQLQMHEPPLIAHVIYRLAIGGLENGLVNLLNRLPCERFRHAVVCLAGTTDFARRIQRPDVAIYSLDKRPGKDMRAYVRFWKLLRQLQPDLVHTRNLGTVDLQWIAAAARVPHRVHGEHGWEASDPWGLDARSLRIRRLCRAAIHRYVAMSQDLARWLGTSVGVAPQRIEQIYNGVDVERFSPEGSLPGDLPWQGASPRPFVFGTVGRLDQVKNQQALLEAFAGSLRASPPGSPSAGSRLIVVGSGPLAATLQGRASELGIGDLVWFAGPRDDIPQLLRAMDVFVLPSMNEGISNTLLEAMATGRPIVAARVGGNPELVEHCSTGLLYDPGQQGGLLEAMLRYRRDGDLTIVHGVAGRRRACERFSLHSMVNRYTDLYSLMLET